MTGTVAKAVEAEARDGNGGRHTDTRRWCTDRQLGQLAAGTLASGGWGLECGVGSWGSGGEGVRGGWAGGGGVGEGMEGGG